MRGSMHLEIIVTGRRAITPLRAVDRQMKSFVASTNAATLASRRFDGAMRLRNMDRFAKDLQWVGRQIEFNFTLPLLVAGGFATKWALDVERASTRVAKVYNEVEGDSLSLAQELEALDHSFRLLSDRLGIHQEEVVSIGAAWAQAGANGAALAQATRLTLETMILGDLGAEEAVESLIAIQQQYQLEVISTKEEVFDLRDAMASLNAVENNTGASFRDLTQALSDMGGVARAAGVPLNEAISMIASLVPAAGNASEAGNGLKTIITRLMAPTTLAKKAMAELGIQWDTSAWQSMTFTERLLALTEKLDGVSEAEKNTALTNIFNRRQISRSIILLEDVIRETGKYATAQEAVATQGEALQAYFRELDVYLGSGPQQLAILTSQMRNLAIEAVIPLIPYILELLSGFRDLMLAFKEMSPATQRLVFYLLLLVALVGPLMRLSGAFGLLFLRVAFFFKGLGTVVAFGVSALSRGFLLITGMIGRFGAVIAGALTGAFRTIGALAAVLPALMSGVFNAIVAGAIAFSRTLGLIWVGLGKGMAVLVTSTAITARGVMTVWGTFTAGMAAAGRTLWYGLGRLWSAGLASLGIITRAAIPLLLNPWTWLIAGVAAIIYAFRDELADLIGNLIDVWYALPAGVRNALIAVVRMVRDAALAVYNWLSYLNPFARHSPSLVDNVKSGVAVISNEYGKLKDIGTVFGAAVDPLNAFGNAVDKVKKKIEEAEWAITREDVVSLAPGAADEFDAIVESIGELETSLEAVGREYEQQERVVNQWKDALDDANFKLEAQELILDQLKDTADALDDELSAVRDRLKELTNTPIEGMGAYSDAIFENQMAQKALRLEILRLEEAEGPLDDLSDRIANLSSDLELLRGEREMLRASNAGSDALGPLDSQIAKLEAEKKALEAVAGTEGEVGQLEALQNQLEELERQGQILDLENSLKFDPLTRQIDDMVNTTEEMPFEELIREIGLTQGQIEELESAYALANLRIEEQQRVVDALAASRDMVSDIYDAEMEKLDQLSEKYDTVKARIDDMNTSIEEFARLASSPAAVRAGIIAEETADSLGGAGGGVGGGAGGGIGGLGAPGEFEIPGGGGDFPTGGDIEAFNAELEAELAGLLDDFDVWAMLREQWEEMIAFLRTKWDEFLDWLGDKGIDPEAILSGIGDAFATFFEDVRDRITGVFESVDTQKIQDAFQAVRTALDPVFTAIGELWDLVVDFFVDVWNEITSNFSITWDDMANYVEVAASVIGGVIGVLIATFTAIWPAVRNTLDAVFDFIARIIGSVVQILSGLIQFILGVFTGDWSRAWEGILNIVQGIWDGILAIFRFVGDLIGGIVGGFIEGIRNLWQWLYDVLIGNSIIPDLVNGVIGWFRTLASWARGIWNGIVNTARTIWEWVRFTVVDKARRLWLNVRTYFENLRSSVRDKWLRTKELFRNTWQWIYVLIVTPFNRLRGIWNIFWAGLKMKVTGIWDGIKSAIGGAIDWLKGRFEWIVGVWNSLPFNNLRIDLDFDAPKNNSKYDSSSSSGGSGGTTYGGSGGSQYFYASGGIITQPTWGLMGEYANARGNPEIVTPERLMASVFRDTLQEYGGAGGGTNVVITGDLVFPNVNDGEDAEAFIRNLESMVN